MDNVNHTDRKHSEIGASSASRWLACPASVKMSRGIEDTKDSPFAIEGTIAHELAEYCFNNNVSAYDCIGKEFYIEKFSNYIVDEDMAGYVQYYVDAMGRYINSDEYDVSIEEKFTLPQIHPDMFGSNDLCAMGIRNGELVIVDFKYGKGINVEAYKNMQLIIYALGAYHDANFIYEFKTVKLIVVQPRIEGKEWDEWEISVEELLMYEDLLKDGVTRVYMDNPEFKTGKHCRFCKVKVTCPHIKKEAEDITQLSFELAPIEEEVLLPEVNTLSNDQIARILDLSSTIQDWLDAVQSYAVGLMVDKGEKIEGFKLVKKRSNRKIGSSEIFIKDFEGTFGDKLYKKSLKSMGELEKLVGKKEIEPYIIKPDAGLTIAPVYDKREEVIVGLLESHEAFSEADKQLEFDNMDF